MEAMRAGTKSIDGVAWCGDQLKNLCIWCMCVSASALHLQIVDRRVRTRFPRSLCAPNVQSSIVADERVMSSFFYTV